MCVAHSLVLRNGFVGLRDKTANPTYITAVDGFGNHDAGRGRYEQAKSDWDVIHPGRAWAEKCNGIHNEASEIISGIESHFKKNIGHQP